MKKDTQTQTYHYTESYLLSPLHPVTITLVGCGGTGSQVLNNLARMNVALIAFGHPGIHVTAWDNDEVTEANLGRQLFASAELGLNKAAALITRINRFYGFHWQAEPKRMDLKKDSVKGNILITAVDKVDIRKEIGKLFTIKGSINQKHNQPQHRNFYWMDFGNSKTSGQVILGTRGAVAQPEKVQDGKSMLPCVTQMFRDLKRYEEKDDTPSCSLAEALNKQDLFINSTLAQLGCNILWKLFREAKIQYHGAYLNLTTLTTNPIKVK